MYRSSNGLSERALNVIEKSLYNRRNNGSRKNHNMPDFKKSA